VANQTVTAGQKNPLALLFDLNKSGLLLDREKVRVGRLDLLRLRSLGRLGFVSLGFDGKFLREGTHFINYLNGNFSNGLSLN